jgi:hypothetical protein
VPIASDETTVSLRYDRNGTIVVTPALTPLNITSRFTGVGVGSRAPSTCSIGVTEFASPAMESKNLLPTHTADFGPDLEFFGPGSSVLGGSDMIAAKVEEVIDLIMG